MCPVLSKPITHHKLPCVHLHLAPPLLPLPSQRHEWAFLPSRAVSALPPAFSWRAELLSLMSWRFLHPVSSSSLWGLLLSLQTCSDLSKVKMTFIHFPSSYILFFATQVSQMNICWILTTHSILNCFGAGFPLCTLPQCFLQASL